VAVKWWFRSPQDHHQTTLCFGARAASGPQDACCIVGALWAFHEKRGDGSSKCPAWVGPCVST